MRKTSNAKADCTCRSGDNGLYRSEGGEERLMAADSGELQFTKGGVGTPSVYVAFVATEFPAAGE